MAQINVQIPEDLDFQIQRLVDEGEFASREEAIQEILSSGLTAYRTNGGQDGDEFDSGFEDDFQPGGPADHEDEYVF